MARRNAHHRQVNRKPHRAALAPPPVAPREPKAPVHYGAPFVLLEDANKCTFKFSGGAWVAYARTIAECRVNCQVKELGQRVNQMTRYEVRAPIELSA